MSDDPSADLYLAPTYQALATITLKLVAAIRRVFPVQDMPWPIAGEDESVAVRPFLELLPRFAKCWWVPNDRGWRTMQSDPDNVPPIACALIDGLHELFRHYGWGVNVLGELDRRKTRWGWPHVPPIPNELLRQLELTARELLEAAGVPCNAVSLTSEPDSLRATIWFHGECQYSVDGETPLKLSSEFDCILQTFLARLLHFY